MQHRRTPSEVSTLRAVTLILALATVPACVPDAPRGVSDTDPTGPGSPLPTPRTGSLTVAVTISGPEAPAEITVVLDGAESVNVGDGEVATWEDLEPGAYELSVGGLPTNCLVDGANPTTVSVSAGLRSSSTFDVVCQATVGAILVESATTGDGTDKDGYAIRLDGEDAGRVEVTGSLLLEGIPPGEHEVEIRNVAKDCEVLGDRKRLVDVVAGLTATVGFAVVCED